MNLCSKFQYVLVISLITSSFSTGGAEETVNGTELPICKGRAVKPCSPFSIPRDCYDLQQLCGDSIGSGLYYIYPVINGEPLQVYCDMDIDGGGWLVFQRREDGSENFYRGWNEYKSGFGSIAGEFWLGNEHLHKLTEHSQIELRVDLQDFDGERAYAKYDNFEITDEGENYKLILGAYSGNAGDAMTYSNVMQFSTKDADNDESGTDCAGYYHKGAWWHKSCTSSNLNGLYLYGPTDDYIGIWWYTWKGYYYSLKETEMKIRPY